MKINKKITKMSDKLTYLLDEVHSLLFDFKGKIKFALTGSSARKIRRSGVNLLAGRALTKTFYPLSTKEVNI